MHSKAQFETFFYLLTAPRTVSSTFAQVAQAQYCANHVQHIERFSRVTSRVTCHVVRRYSPTIESDSLNRIYLSFILLAESLTDEGGEETGVLGENPRRRASEIATY